MPSERPPSLTSSSPPRRFHDVRESLDDPLAQRRRVRPAVAERLGEAQPFGAVIVAMLEQVLGDLDLYPTPRAGAGQQHHRAHGHHGEQADHDGRRPIDPGAAKGGGDDGHQREVGADAEQRERLEGRGPREPETPALVVPCAKGEQRRRQCDREAAPLEQRCPRARANVGRSVEIEVVAPHPGESEHREADVRAARRRRLPVEIVDEDQRPGGGGDPEDQAGLLDSGDRRDDCQHACNDLHANGGRDRTINQADAVLPLIARR
jgi:hypothetical protein